MQDVVHYCGDAGYSEERYDAVIRNSVFIRQQSGILVNVACRIVKPEKAKIRGNREERKNVAELESVNEFSQLSGIVSIGTSTEDDVGFTSGELMTDESSSSLWGLRTGLEFNERALASASSFRRASNSRSNL